LAGGADAGYRVFDTPQKIIAYEIAKWGKVINFAGIKPD
jgi:hypothetical protein